MRKFELFIDDEHVWEGETDPSSILVRITDDDGRVRTISYEDT